MTKTRILGICQHFYPELVSTGLHMTELFTGLSSYKDNEITIFCSYPIKKEYKDLNPAKEETFKDIKVHRTSNVGTEHGTLFQRMIYNLLFFFKACVFAWKKRKDYDMILLTTDPPFIGTIPWLISKWLKKPYILIVYDVYPDIAVKLDVLPEKGIMTKFWKGVNRGIYKNASKLVVIGEDMKSIIKDKTELPESSFALIHNWSDKNNVYPVEKQDNRFLQKEDLSDKRILLYSGNMGRTHNVEAILDAATVLDGKYEDVLFLFIGGGKKKEKVQKHIENGVSSNVKLLPFQPFEILSDVLSSAYFSFVCLEDEFTGMSVPSKSYGIMASGTPIMGVLRADSEISVTIKKFDCGWVWDAKGESLASLIEQVLSQPNEVAEKGQNALRAFKENFDVSISVAKYNDLVKELNGK